MWNRFVHWLQHFINKLFIKCHYRYIRHVDSIQKVQEIRCDEIVLVGHHNQLKWAILECPCGCGDIIHVDLMKSHHPHWIVIFEKHDKLSFYPSLWVDEHKCGSHFFISHSNVKWCE
jgi:hypothetical protein